MANQNAGNGDCLEVRLQDEIDKRGMERHEYPGGAGYASIFRTVFRASPNSRATSR